MKKIGQIRWSDFSMREKTLALLTAGAILYIFIVFFYLPRQTQWKELYAQKSSLESEMLAISSALPELMKKAEAARINISLMASSPSRGSDSILSMFLEEINQAARMKEVQVVELRPGVIEKRDKYDVLPIQVKARSSFRNLDEYILALERLPQPIGVDHLKIESNVQSRPGITADITLLIYKKGGA